MLGDFYNSGDSITVPLLLTHVIHGLFHGLYSVWKVAICQSTTSLSALSTLRGICGLSLSLEASLSHFIESS